jgi:hypothetical protein
MSINELRLESDTKDDDGVLLQSPEHARTAVNKFLATSPQGKQLTPISLAVDDVSTRKLRLKWYFHIPKASFASVRHIITLGAMMTSP